VGPAAPELAGSLATSYRSSSCWTHATALAGATAVSASTAVGAAPPIAAISLGFGSCTATACCAPPACAYIAICAARVGQQLCSERSSVAPLQVDAAMCGGIWVATWPQVAAAV